MYNHNKAQQSKNCVHISWDILYVGGSVNMDSGNGLSHLWHQSIIWTNTSLQLDSEKYFSDSLIEIEFKHFVYKITVILSRPQCVKLEDEWVIISHSFIWI